MDNWFYRRVIIPLIEVIERAAEIAQGTLRPVSFIDNLHFEIDNCVFIQFNSNIQNEFCQDQIDGNKEGFFEKPDFFVTE